MAQAEKRSLAREIFEKTLDIGSAEERAAYVRQACGTDMVLFQRLQVLIQANDLGDSFLPDQPRIGITVPTLEMAGCLIGRYKLLEQIGEGGMGVVYMAEQEEPVRRQVALKLIKAGMDTRQVIARFEAERQALALMDHPNIARVLDGGTTEREPGTSGQESEVNAPPRVQLYGPSLLAPDSRPPTPAPGRPFFVMELVRGLRITDYVRDRALPLLARLELFLQVCSAVQHAHQKGIIHRDLKPSNILVTEVDGKPVPKVIDFGVAKALHAKLTDQSVHTQLTTLIGTPAYMSPEQAEMTGEDIDTRSDIYSLGILLYELLAGAPPWRNEELLAAGLDGMREIIKEADPERPSKRVESSKRLRVETGTANAIATPNSQFATIPTDLDAVVLKCLEKDRARRYETASALAADIQRHLGNEPVLARQPSAAYRFQKMVRRHRNASVAVALMTLALVLGVTVSTWALLRERAARKQADQRLSAALGFVDQVLNAAPEMRLVAGAGKAQANLLQAGLDFMQRLRETADEDPAARVALARLLFYMSAMQSPGEPNTVGDYETGLKRAEEGLKLLSAETPQLSETERLLLAIQGRFAVIQCLYGLGRFDEGVAHSKEVEPLLDRMERLPEQARQARRSRMLLRGNAGWASFVVGRTNEALGFVLSILDSDWARGITEDPNWEELQHVMNAHDIAGNVYGLLLKDFKAMLPHAEESVRIGELAMSRFPGNAHFVNLTAQNRAWQGYALLRMGRIDDGLAALRRARNEIEALMKTGPTSEAFRRHRVIIAGVQAMAFAGWSEDASSSLAERRQRLAQAEAYLREAEEFSHTVKSPTRTLPTARAEVPAARAKLEADELRQNQP